MNDHNTNDHKDDYKEYNKTLNVDHILTLLDSRSHVFKWEQTQLICCPMVGLAWEGDGIKKVT